MHIETRYVILRVARDVRRAFEAGTFNTDLAMAEYGTYASVPDVELFFRHARALFPAMNCGICSVYIRAVLGRGIIVRGRYNDHPHTIVATDGMIVDITADQFGGPAVYVGRVRPPWELGDVATTLRPGSRLELWQWK